MTEATRRRYLSAWVLAGVYTAIAAQVVQFLFAYIPFFKNITTVDSEAGQALFYTTVFVLQFLIWLYTYKSFPMLNYTKVIPYLWVFSIVSAIFIFLLNVGVSFKFGCATAGMAIVSCAFLTDQLSRYEEAKDINATATD